MFFEDLSTYHYHLPFNFEGVLNVGWLTCDRPFTRGAVPAAFTDTLYRLAFGKIPGVDSHVNCIRGQHPCAICGNTPNASFGDAPPICLGSSELWIPSDDVLVYAAPSMILHYVVDHDYEPPTTFVDSVISLRDGIQFNGQLEYERRLAANVGS